MRIVISGLMGLIPSGGVTWDYLQYPLGMHQLGHDVFYIEDTGIWPLFLNSSGAVSLDGLSRVMKAVGMGDRWAYRDEARNEWHGLPEEKVLAIYRTADLFLNISCAASMREEVMAIPYRALVDSDPMFTQVQIIQDQSILNSQGGVRKLFDAHTHHFTFGESIRHPGCRIPSTGHRWHPTRQPICLSHWPAMPLPTLDIEPLFTTVMNWGAANDLLFESELWGQKNREFEAVINLPSQIKGLRLAVAMSNRIGAPIPEADIQKAGWLLLDPQICAADWLSYHRFIQSSFAEFSVAKHTYVKAHTGWFSCRSACYLATGRPVVTQDTGWSEILPNGEGLLAFRTMEEAVDALERVMAAPEHHAKAARRIAESCFDSQQVLQDLLNTITG